MALRPGRRLEEGWRWRVVDPWGLPVYCAEATWYTKVYTRERAEVRLYERELIATVRDPDEVYVEPEATAKLRRQGLTDAEVLHYVGYGRTQGPYAHHMTQVVVKKMIEPDQESAVGYVRTLLVPRGLRLGKLTLRWRKS